MKYILSILVLALVCAATPVFAAFTYEVVKTQYTNAYYEGTWGQYFMIRVTDGTGKLYITDFLNNTESGVQTETLTAPDMGVTHYGYAFVSGTDHSIHSFSVSNSTYIPEFGSYTYDENDTTYTYYRQGYELGTFSKNDEVEIYLANENDALRSNTPIPGRNFSSFGQRTDKLNHDLQVGQLSLSGTQVNFGIVGVGIDSIIPGDDDGPFGSPLPGKLAIALVSVCFALGFWYIRRKKAFAA